MLNFSKFLMVLLLIFPMESFAANLKIKKDIPVKVTKDDSEDFEDIKNFDFQVKSNADVYDPLESVNRKIFVFNDYLDRKIVRYVAISYQKSLPKPVRKSIRNFITNASTPFSVVNSLLQGDGENAMASFSSFLINSTIGVGGLFDVAGNKNITYNQEDLGQTLAVYGLGSGPYLVIPLIGPSNLRDGVGNLATSAVDPLSINAFKIGNDSVASDETILGFTVISLIDKRESLLKIVDDLRANSFDSYATTRSAYSQNRTSKIKNQN